MHTTYLRKVGGSIMLAVPRAVLDVLRLRPGAKVDIAIERGPAGGGAAKTAPLHPGRTARPVPLQGPPHERRAGMAP